MGICLQKIQPKMSIGCGMSDGGGGVREGYLLHSSAHCRNPSCLGLVSPFEASKNSFLLSQSSW